MSSVEKWSVEHAGPRHYTNVTIEMAFRVAARWPGRLPTWQELVEEYGMDRATAFRWRRAMKDARGIQ